MLDPDKLSNDEIRLALGEMTAQEARTARAAIRWANSQTVYEIERLRSALHATIFRPAGVVPDIALEFYDPKHPALRNMAQR